MKYENFTVRPTLRMYFPQLTVLACLMGLAIYFRFACLPKNGLYVFQIYDVKNQWIRSKIVGLLRFKITYSMMCYAAYAFMFILLNWAATYWVKVKFTYFNFTNKYFEYGSGMFSQQKDSIDMVNIKDQDLHRTPGDVAWGLSRIKIWSKDEVSPIYEIKGINHNDATRVFDHLKKYSIRTFSDYRLAQDMEKAEGSANDEGKESIDVGDDTVIKEDKTKVD